MKVLALLASLALGAHAMELPEFTGEWANGGPFTKEGLKGKLVVLYFFEEGCPTCRAKWPGLDKTFKEYENEPILFIAINSGNAKRQVEGYAQAVHTNLSVYVDSDNSFEKAFGIAISLQNIIEWRAADGNGTVHGYGSVPELLQKHKGSIRWKVPPADVPEILKPVWRGIEFGQYAKNVPALRMALNSGDAKVKEAAKKIETVLITEIDARVASGKKNQDAGNKWAAYKDYSFVTENFRDFAQSKPAQAELTRLRSDAKVAREIQAKTMLDKIQQMMVSPKKVEQDQAKLGLATLEQQFADTEAGTTAKSMLR